MSPGEELRRQLELELQKPPTAARLPPLLKAGHENVTMLKFTSLQVQENHVSPFGSIPAARGQAGLTPEPPRSKPFGFPAFLPLGSVTSRL